MQTVEIALSSNTAKFLTALVVSSLNPTKGMQTSNGMLAKFERMIEHPGMHRDVVEKVTTLHPSEVEKYVNAAKRAGLIEGEEENTVIK